MTCQGSGVRHHYLLDWQEARMMSKIWIILSLVTLATSSAPKGAYIEKLNPQNPYDIEGDDIDKGGEVSKCRQFNNIFNGSIK
jgi:hypothetical protein